MKNLELLSWQLVFHHNLGGQLLRKVLLLLLILNLPLNVSMSIRCSLNVVKLVLLRNQWLYELVNFVTWHLIIVVILFFFIENVIVLTVSLLQIVIWNVLVVNLAEVRLHLLFIRIVFVENALLDQGKSVIYLDDLFNHMRRILGVYCDVFNPRSRLIILVNVV